METTLTSLDLFWFFFSTVTLGLLGILTWLARRIFTKMDSIDEKFGKVMIDQATDKQELRDHIANTGVHCKDGDCLYRRRVEDAAN